MITVYVKWTMPWKKTRIIYGIVLIGPSTAYISGIPIATVLPKQDARPNNAESSVL